VLDILGKPPLAFVLIYGTSNNKDENKLTVEKMRFDQINNINVILIRDVYIVSIDNYFC